jgi:hypothetical protein
MSENWQVLCLFLQKSIDMIDVASLQGVHIISLKIMWECYLALCNSSLEQLPKYVFGTFPKVTGPTN